MAGHARLSASQTERWWTCPGSVPMVEAVHGTRPESSSWYAMQGTAAHAILEHCLGKGIAASKMAGRTVVVFPKGGTSILKQGASPKADQTNFFEVDADMYEAVDECINYVKARQVELGISDEHLYLERKVIPLPDRDDTGGTADVTLDSWPEVLEIIDYKHGSGKFVSVKGNKQLRSYMLGAAREDQFSHEIYRYAVAQPRMSGSAPIRWEEMTRQELIDWELHLSLRAEAVDDATAKFKADGMDTEFIENFLHASEKGCEWCDMFADCPAAANVAFNEAVADFDDEPDTLDHEIKDREALGKKMKWVPYIESWCKAIRARGEMLVLGGEKVPLWKAVMGKDGNRTWKDGLEPKEIVRHVIGEGWIDADEADDKLFKPAEGPKLITGPQMKKVMPKEYREDFDDALLYRPPGKPIVVPEDDERPEISIDPADDFADVED